MNSRTASTPPLPTSTGQSRLARPGVLLAAFCCLTVLIPAPGADNPKSQQGLPPPQRVVVPKLRGKLTLDGDLNEPVWAKAALLTPFMLNDGSGPEREKTAVRLWYDNRALHLGWTCTDADIQATFAARDSKF